MILEKLLHDYTTSKQEEKKDNFLTLNATDINRVLISGF